jgi:Tfp pilus assembly protein PilP
VRAVLIALLVTAVAAPLHAQPAAAPRPHPPAAGAAPGAAPQAPATTEPAEGYSYNSEGRRDPFTSLIGTGGADPRGSARPGDGIGAMAVSDVAVRGIMQSRGALVAMVQGPDNKTYIVHQGDRLLDGSIKSITPQGIVLIQDVNDPLSLVKQREVSKLLRSVEAVKQ